MRPAAPASSPRRAITNDAMTPTPTLNASLPFQRCGFSSLAQALDYAARGETGFNFYNARGQLLSVLPYRDLKLQAESKARKLLGLGLHRGDRMLLIADTTPEFVVTFMACQYAGIVAVPVSLPAGLGAKSGYVDQLALQLAGSGARAAMASAGLGGFLGEAAEGANLLLHGEPAAFAALPEASVDLQPLGADERCYLQYSSGSTRFPLGVDVTQRALMANILGMSSTGLDIRPEDRAISWLPLYHDMGLIGFMLGPICNQLSVDLMPTREFARRPSVWLTMISQNRNTVSYSPTFGYDLSMRRLSEEQIAALDLSCWRRAGIGGDMVQPHVLRRFAEAFAVAGFRESAFVPTYGMAETCLGVAFAPADAQVRVDRVLRERLTQGFADAAPAAADERVARTLAICGFALPGHVIEIRDERGRKLPDRRIGRIFVQGPSVTPGYFQQPEATAAVLHEDGWLDTGDLGYMLDGEVVVTGRAKDLIIVNGRNIWPQDLEWAVEALPGLRRGDVAAFAVSDDHGGEDVVILVQARLTDIKARDELRRAVEGAVREQAAIECRVVLVPPHALPQTTSGKLSRSRARSLYLQGQYGEPADLVPAES